MANPAAYTPQGFVVDNNRRAAMNKAYLARLLAHAHWANARTLAALPASELPAEAVRLFAHVLTTEQIYHQRLTEQDPWPQDFWPDLSLQDCARLVPANRDLYQHFLAHRTDEDLARPVRYRNSRGTVFHTARIDMLTHLMLHGQHHRGQIAQVLRRHSHTPPVIDFITFVREIG